MVFLIEKLRQAWKRTILANKHVHSGRFLMRKLLTPERVTNHQPSTAAAAMADKDEAQKTCKYLLCELQSQFKSRYHRMNQGVRS